MGEAEYLIVDNVGKLVFPFSPFARGDEAFLDILGDDFDALLCEATFGGGEFDVSVEDRDDLPVHDWLAELFDQIKNKRRFSGLLRV